MGEVVLRRDDEARGVPVDAVDDAGPLLPPDAGEGVPAVVEQGVDQGPVGVARGGMHHQALGLVEDDDVLVLVDHVQGDVLGEELRLLRLRQGHRQGLAAPETVVLGQGFAAAGDLPVLQEAGGGGAGQVLPLVCQPGIDPPAGGLRRHGEGQGAHGRPPLSRFSWRKR